MVPTPIKQNIRQIKPFPQIGIDHEKNPWSNHKPQLLDPTLPHWDPYPCPTWNALVGFTHTSAMVEATSASMATGCPNKPRNAVQKEGKVSSSNVLDPWIPWIPRNKMTCYRYLPLLFFGLQIIYLIGSEKKTSQKNQWMSKSSHQFFWCKKLPVKIPNLKDFIQGGDFPGCSFFHGEKTTTLGVEGPSL